MSSGKLFQNALATRSDLDLVIDETQGDIAAARELRAGLIEKADKIRARHDARYAARVRKMSDEDMRAHKAGLSSGGKTGSESDEDTELSEINRYIKHVDTAIADLSDTHRNAVDLRKGSPATGTPEHQAAVQRTVRGMSDADFQRAKAEILRGA